MAPAVRDSDNNAAMSSMDLERLLSMKGGKGEASYAKNSQAQVLFISDYCIMYSAQEMDK